MVKTSAKALAEAAVTVSVKVFPAKASARVLATGSVKASATCVIENIYVNVGDGVGESIGKSIGDRVGKSSTEITYPRASVRTLAKVRVRLLWIALLGLYMFH